MKKKREKIVWLLAGFILLSNCLFAGKEDTSQHYFPADNQLIQYTGRIDFTNKKLPRYWQPGVYAKARFAGTYCNVILNDEMLWGKNHNYLEIVIDDTILYRLQTKGKRDTIRVAKDLSNDIHTILIAKNTEANIGYIEFVGLQCKRLLPLPFKPARKMEFIGNSITCGYAVEDTSGKDRGTAPYENAYIGYAAITARHFKAAFNCTVKSGIGITISWFPLIMPEMYDRLDPEDPNSKWDFSRFRPDVVVVNLFQNDSWLVNMPDNDQFKARFGKTPPGADTIVSAYKRFIQQVRERYPDAYIICMLGNMDATREGSPWPGYIQKAVGQLADKKMYTLFIPFKGTNGHPSRTEQQSLANGLIHFIEGHIRW